MRSRFWLCLVVFSVFTALGCPASAHPPRAGAPYTIDVEDESGTPLRTFEHGSELFVLGNYGQRYVLVLRNQTGRRVEAVVTVDGRDVVSGHAGDFVRERGYVLGPYATLRIDGFRKSYEAVAAFRFSTPEGSYSARMGTPENVGVIGAAFFPERVYREPRPQPLAAPVPESERRQRDDAPARKSEAPRSAAAESSGAYDRAEAKGDSLDGLGAAAAPSVNNLGTEYGETRTSHVEEVRFVRASSDKPAYVSVLHYDNVTGLTARGIEIEPRHISCREPDPFPRNRFAPPPP
jgi:hypothetical protein